MTLSVEELTAYFQSCGFSEMRAVESAKGKAGAQAHAFFVANELEKKGTTDKQGHFALAIAKEVKLGEAERSYALEAVVDGRLKAVDQVTAALKYLATHPVPVDAPEFDAACGVGFSATAEQVDERVRSYVTENHADLVKTGWNGLGKVVANLRTSDGLRWVNALEIKTAVEKVFLDVFGPKVSAAAAAKAAKDAKPVVAATAPASKAEEAAPEEIFGTGWLGRLHKPGQNEQINPQRMVEHLLATKGKVFTRFPPEPNGFLHIGHSKAIAVNFGYAKYHGGHCYLRYDDTNPEAEEQIYFDKILEAVRWLGFEPYKITHSSDHFQELYDLAVNLIKRGLAYTSNDSAADIAIQRGGKDYHLPRTDSKDRSKSIEQSLKEFEDMRLRKYKPGEMTLRMKQDMQHPMPIMWDIIAYRVLDAPHHRTGTDWCIYPTYDFTHCLCDSFENISHSLCTTEFIMARTSYEWLCDALEVYKPRQSEFGRLALEGTVTSKRKLLRLVKEGLVSGWDDPRLYTIVALKRRGVPPGAIINFVSHVGVSTTPSLIQLARFEQEVRQYLETSTPRLMMVLHPVRITIENLPSDFLLSIEKPVHPKNPSMGSNVVPFTNIVYIDQDDFRTTFSKDFFRLSPGASVGLLNVPHPITHVSHETNAEGVVTSIVCRYENGPTPPKPKVWIQWVAEHAPSNSPVRIVETRIFKRLFKSDNPAGLGDDYIKDIDPESLKVVEGALLEVGIWKVVKDSLAAATAAVEARKAASLLAGTDAPPQVDGVEAIRFQGLRVAYFTLDSDSHLPSLENGAELGRDGKDKLVLNLIAPLKQDAGKKA